MLVFSFLVVGCVACRWSLGLAGALFVLLPGDELLDFICAIAVSPDDDRRAVPEAEVSTASVEDFFFLTTFRPALGVNILRLAGSAPALFERRLFEALPGLGEDIFCYGFGEGQEAGRAG